MAARRSAVGNRQPTSSAARSLAISSHLSPSPPAPRRLPPAPLAQTFFNSDPGSDALGRVQGQLKEVKDVMVENIEKVLARGEKIELLVDKTEELSQTARRFQYQSKNLKDMMWWKNVKMWLIIIFIVLIVIYFIVSFICGFNFDKCK